MKKTYLLLTAVLFLLFSSCNDDNEKQEETPVNEYDGPSALSIKSVIYSSYNANDSLVSGVKWFPEVEYEESSLWCAGDDIEWFDATTNILMLNTRPPATYGDPPFYRQYLIVFLDDKQLIRFEIENPVSSAGAATIPYILNINGLFYIGKTPLWPQSEKDWKAIESEWNIFIEQLKKEGRYKE